MPIIPRRRDRGRRRPARCPLHGARDDIAATMADATAWAEARGNRVLRPLLSRVLLPPTALGPASAATSMPRSSAPRPSLVRVDARDGFAQPAFRAALPVALDAARATGLASIAIHRAHTCTALGWFTEARGARGRHRARHDECQRRRRPSGRTPPHRRDQPHRLRRARRRGRSGDGLRPVHHPGRAGEGHDGEGRGQADPRRLGARRQRPSDDGPRTPRWPARSPPRAVTRAGGWASWSNCWPPA